MTHFSPSDSAPLSRMIGSSVHEHALIITSWRFQCRSNQAYCRNTFRLPGRAPLLICQYAPYAARLPTSACAPIALAGWSELMSANYSVGSRATLAMRRPLLCSRPCSRLVANQVPMQRSTLVGIPAGSEGAHSANYGSFRSTRRPSARIRRAAHRARVGARAWVGGGQRSSQRWSTA